MYDQSGQTQSAPIAANTQPAAATANAVFNSSALTAFSTAVVPVKAADQKVFPYPEMCSYTDPNSTAAAPYGAAHNIYPGQILYTPDQYNPAGPPNQVPQYINYPVGYTYPYNGEWNFRFWDKNSVK